MSVEITLMDRRIRLPLRTQRCILSQSVSRLPIKKERRDSYESGTLPAFRKVYPQLAKMDCADARNTDSLLGMRVPASSQESAHVRLLQ